MNNLNGIYSASFHSNLGVGTGTVFLVNNQIYGGDAIVAYWGNYNIVGNDIHAHIEIRQHQFGVSLLGSINRISFIAPVNDCRIEGDAIVPGTGLSFHITLTKILGLE